MSGMPAWFRAGSGVAWVTAYDGVKRRQASGRRVESTQGKLLLPQLRLDDLLAELQVRLAAVVKTRDRVHALLEAGVAVGSNPELEAVLRPVSYARATPLSARYAAPPRSRG